MPTQSRPFLVAGVDGSRAGLLALDWAADQAARRNWLLKAIHVIEQPGSDDTLMHDEATAELARLGCTDGQLESRSGRPAEILLEESREARLLVIGRRDGGGFAELTAWSTSQICTALARTSLVVVPDSWQPDRSEEGLIVVGVDGSPSGQSALGFAFEAAAERDAELVLVHVPSDPGPQLPLGLRANPERAPWHQDAQRVLREALAGWPEKYPEVVFRSNFRPGHPVEVLAQHSEYADLMVVGGVERSHFTPLRLGSVSRGLLHHTRCPLAIVHQEP
ncbi:universal stress protein [Kribbella qitaiheensis]|uniref:universal stress protein n=1 Tax=Kribbella qitaiheensis TaxID=1544730 RepID=UPI001623D70C|nr:universal stress protein [Kribbella qitaiheensis]